jgi:2,3-bisphosphoglycerate-dependent phosphoglycerate mutase
LSKTTIYFVRHAHSTYSLDEESRPLSEKGIKDTECVTSVLKDFHIDLVISSPYKRAIQTVEGIADHFQLKIVMMDDLKERKLSDHPVPHFRKAMDKVWCNPELALEGGESNRTAQNRGVRAIKYILEKYREQNIVIGTHGNIMVLIMNYFDSRYGYHFWQALAMPDIYQLTFRDDHLIHVKRVDH